MSEKSYKYQTGRTDTMATVARISSGIEGLDEMLGGGFPLGHIIVVMGDTGTGKTTLGLQFIVDGLEKGENGIYISLEEDKDSIISTAKSYGWDLEKYIKDKKLIIIKLDLSDIKTAARRVKTELPGLIKNFGAKRLVIDSVTLFNMMFEDPVERRIRLVGLNNAVKQAGITAVYTAETGTDILHSKDGVVEYAADGVLFLRQFDDVEDIKSMIRIVKMRRASHDRLYRCYEITDTGIVVNAACHD